MIVNIFRIANRAGDAHSCRVRLQQGYIRQDDIILYHIITVWNIFNFLPVWFGSQRKIAGKNPISKLNLHPIERSSGPEP